MNPKVLVAILALVNLSAGVGLGVALDRYALPCPERAEVRAGDGSGDAKSRRGRRHWKKGRQSMKDRTQQRVNRLTKELGLDSQQAVKVQAVFEARGPKFMAVFAEVRPRLLALEQETHAELSAILRPELQEKLDAMRKRFEGRGPWGRGGPGHRKSDGERKR
jgi:hypothetical protein